MSIRVLVVEDDEPIRSLMSRALARAGCEVTTACDGQQAIETLAGADFDVMVLDLMMPRVSGFGVLDHLAASESELIHRTIVASAYVPSAAAGELRDVCRVIRKPFDPSAFLQAVLDCAASP